MPFVEMPGLVGKVYVPEISDEIPKKYPCKDCFSCQMCSDDRCRVCRKGKIGKSVKQESAKLECCPKCAEKS